MTTVQIPLSKGKFAIIDECDLFLVSHIAWNVGTYRHTCYARSKLRIDGKIKNIYMHRIIIGVKDDVEIDHKNGNGLDNRRENLRIANGSQNNGNQRLSVRNTSGFKGVHLDKRREKWQVLIKVRGKRIFGGYFADKIEAAHAYDTAARKAFGKFAALNFPEPGEQSCHERGNQL